MVPSFFTGFGVFPAIPLGKHPLPAPIGGGVRILARNSIRQVNPAPAVVQIVPMDDSHVGKVLTEHWDYGLRQHRHAVFTALPVTNQNFALVEIDILNTQRQALRQAKPTAVENCCCQFYVTRQVVKQCFRFPDGQDHRKANRFARTHNATEITNLSPRHIAKKETKAQPAPGFLSMR